MELMCCFVLILSSLRRTLRFALVKEVVTGTYNDPKHTLKKEERKRDDDDDDDDDGPD